MEILTKHEKQRKAPETNELIQGLSKLEIFNANLINQGLNPKTTVGKLVPFFTIEYFPSNTAIFHYGNSSRIFKDKYGFIRRCDRKALYSLQGKC